MTLQEFLTNLNQTIKGVYYISQGVFDFRTPVYLTKDQKHLLAMLLDDFLVGITGGDKAPGYIYFEINPNVVSFRGMVDHHMIERLSMEATINEVIQYWGHLEVKGGEYV